MTISGIPINQVSRATLDTPNNPPKLDSNGNLPALVTVRAGTATELNAIVLKANELAIEISGAGKPQIIRAGDGLQAGGFPISGNSVINQVFGGPYPAVPVSTSTSTWTDIPNSAVAVNTLGYVVNYSFLFSVPPDCGLEFYWAPFRFLPIRIHGGPIGLDMNYMNEGGMAAISLPDTESGFFYVSASGIAVTGIEAPAAAKFRCKTAPASGTELRCTRFYAEYRRYGLLPP